MKYYLTTKIEKRIARTKRVLHMSDNVLKIKTSANNTLSKYQDKDTESQNSIDEDYLENEDPSDNLEVPVVESAREFVMTTELRDISTKIFSASRKSKMVKDPYFCLEIEELSMPPQDTPQSIQYPVVPTLPQASIQIAKTAPPSDHLIKEGIPSSVSKATKEPMKVIENEKAVMLNEIPHLIPDPGPSNSIPPPLTWAALLNHNSLVLTPTPKRIGIFRPF
jgi:hypothetical protein